MLLEQAGKTSEALTAWEQSRSIKQKIADAHPGVAEYGRDLAVTQCNIGILLRETGKPTEALAMHEAALAILQRLADDYPAASRIQDDLAYSLTETGDVHRVRGHTAEAQACYSPAVEILDGLVKKNVTFTRHQEHLVQALRGLGAIQFDDRKIADAVATWRRAIAIGERMRSTQGELLYYLAGCHALLGGAAGAPGSGLSAEAGRSELDRAMDLLRRAVSGRYHPVNWMRRDPDLDALRRRPDFQLLMMDLAFPAEPFATTD